MYREHEKFQASTDYWELLMASIVFDDTFEVSGIDNEKFDNVSRIKAKVRNISITELKAS